MSVDHAKRAKRRSLWIRFVSHPFVWVVAYGLLVSAARLHSDVIRGPGEYFLPILLFGVVGGFVLGYRWAKQYKIATGAVWAFSFIFIVCICVPYWLRWGYLEWYVRTIPLPPAAESVRRSTEPARFAGMYTWRIEGEVKLPGEAMERYMPPGKPRNYAGLNRVRNETSVEIEDFYRKHLGSQGWTAGATSKVFRAQTGFVENRSTNFTRDAETVSLKIITNTRELTFILQHKDPPVFGPIRLPDLPWTGRPRMPTPLPAPTNG